MILLSSNIQKFEAEFLDTYHGSILPSHRKALNAMKFCRTTHSPLMLANCNDCDNQVFIPHSCGHRSCPHCQQHESQQWLERQLKKQVPAEYFLLTFTLPQEFRSLAWRHQHTLYSFMTRCSWETVKTFTLKDKQLRGNAGAVTVLHTHSRLFNFHPHVHMVMPAAALDTKKRLWRTKRKKKGKTAYLFNQKALAKVFRAKMLNAIKEEGLELPDVYPKAWVVNCKSVGSGEKALLYLGRYLYKGVIQEKDILSCQDGKVTFRYQDSKTKQARTRTLPGAQFLKLILQHVLPKGFRRTRNFGFLHSNSKRMLELLQVFGLNPNRVLAWFRKRPQIKCPSCGGTMTIVATMIQPPLPPVHPPPKDERVLEGEVM